jgi:hypothetical protein
MIAILKRWFGIHPPGAIELKRGSVYVIECPSPMKGEEFEALTEYLATVTEKTECEFLVLDHGLKIAVNK